MAMWHSPTCDCRAWLDADGEPTAYEARCNLHQDAPVAILAQRCRAKELAKAQVRARPGGAEADEPLIEFDEQGRAVATHIDFMSARMTRKTVAPISLEDFVAGIGALTRG